jgi:hypothetical protein
MSLIFSPYLNRKILKTKFPNYRILVHITDLFEYRNIFINTFVLQKIIFIFLYLLQNVARADANDTIRLSSREPYDAQSNRTILSSRYNSVYSIKFPCQFSRIQ